MTKKEFIDLVAPAAQQACKGTSIFPSVTIAQAILETGWGAHSVGNNLYGIKATGVSTAHWNGEYVEAKTIEYIGGRKRTINAKFRKYSSVVNSIKDHNSLLQLPRYKRVRDSKTPEEQCRMLKVCGYATDPSYSDKLISIIRTNNLKQYDGED